jgi:hypothetical protein
VSWLIFIYVLRTNQDWTLLFGILISVFTIWYIKVGTFISIITIALLLIFKQQFGLSMNEINSPTPLFKNRGITNDSEIMVLNQPKNYIDFFLDFPSNVVISKNENNQCFEFIHVFVKTV